MPHQSTEEIRLEASPKRVRAYLGGQLAGMIGFYNETLDIYVDGMLLDKPITEFSRTAG